MVLFLRSRSHTIAELLFFCFEKGLTNLPLFLLFVNTLIFQSFFHSVRRIEKALLCLFLIGLSSHINNLRFVCKYFNFKPLFVNTEVKIYIMLKSKGVIGVSSCM